MFDIEISPLFSNGFVEFYSGGNEKSMVVFAGAFSRKGWHFLQEQIFYRNKSKIKGNKHSVGMHPSVEKGL